jgi:DNA-binding transcriptional regulator GbsR (MarR family)
MYAEDAAVVLEGMGVQRAYGKLLGYLLICDPPQQSSSDLAGALDLSMGSVSMGTRMLDQAGLIRRVPTPGRRKVYEMTDDAIIRASRSDTYRVMRDLMERGLHLIGHEDAPRARRLRHMRDFYAFMERELPRLVERFKAEYGEASDG